MWAPTLSTIRRVPDADVGTYIDIVGFSSINSDGIVFDIEQRVGTDPAAHDPLGTVEPPNATAVSHAAESHKDGGESGVGPIYSDIRNQAGEPERTRRHVVEAREGPGVLGHVSA